MRNKATALVGILLVGATVRAMPFGTWSPAVSVESLAGTDASFNTAALDGCPAVSRSGLDFYMASNRPGGQGGIDVWVSHRESADDPWGAPENLTAVNTSADDFCPMPLRNGGGLLFVSSRAGGCGGSDIYFAERHPVKGWSEAVHLDCSVNSAGDEASPFLTGDDDGQTLYFSSTRAGGFSAEPIGSVTGDADIYASHVASDGSVWAPELVPTVNSAFNDFRPHVRRDGLELLFDSNRPGGVGLLDIWTAERATTSAAWGVPENAGQHVNSVANETRPYLSWGGTVLYFGTTRAGVEGSSDIYQSIRVKANDAK